MRIVCLIVFSALALQAGAVFTFESPTYTAPTSITGQDGWTNPVPGGADGQVLTYASGAIATNPEGGAQYLFTLGETTDARSQHDVDLSGGNIWTLTYDMLMWNPGPKEAMENAANITLWSTPIGSEDDPGFMTIFGYMGTTSNSPWGIMFYVADSGGAMQQDIAWVGLSQNTWYRVSTVFDLSTKQVLGGSLYNLTSGVPVSDWTPSASRYFAGGAASTFTPNAVRVYSDTTAGDPSIMNGVAWDNLTLSSSDTGGVPEPATFAMASAALAALVWWRRK